MAVTPKVIIPAKQAEAAETTQYTCPAATRMLLDKFTGCNTTGAAATLTARIVTVGGAAGVANTITSAKAVQPGETYSFPELVGQVLQPGDFISTLASAVAITIRCSGREVS